MAFEVAVVIPAYNEAKRIRKVIKEIEPYADEIIVVNDCSTDNTAAIANELGVKVIEHKVNRGHKEAVKTGFQAASKEMIVTYDADGEYSAEQIPKLVAPLQDSNVDVVTGRRNEIPRISERIITLFTSLLINVSDTGAGFKAIRAQLAKQLELHGFCICGIFLLEAARKGGDIVEIPVTVRSIQKTKHAAWHHLPQMAYLAREMCLFLHNTLPFAP